MHILISGAGIAGLTTAYWLQQHGHNVTLVEKHADFQEHYGYMIDFWGPGYEVADKMQLLPELCNKHYKIPKMFYVNDRGKHVGYLNIIKLRKALENREFTFLRGDLENTLYDHIANNITMNAGVTIQSLQQSTDQVHVKFSNNHSEDYDIVIGADGIHSQIRQILFGNENQFSRNLGYHIAAFIQPNTLNIKNFFAYSKPAKQVALFPIRGNRVATYFMYKADGPCNKNRKQEIYEHFKNDNWIIPDILQSLEQTNEIYLDTVTQIELPQWSQGRVALVGDACQCMTLLAGQGASMAMAGGYLLAKELHAANNDYAKAFHNYQAKLQPDIIRKQQQARKFIRQFIPNTNFGIRTRNAVTNILNTPILAKLFFDRSFQFSRKYLPDYLK